MDTTNPLMGMLTNMLPMIMGMIDDETIRSMADLLGNQLTEIHGIELITTWNKEGDSGEYDYTPAEFLEKVFGLIFADMKAQTDIPVAVSAGLFVDDKPYL